MGGQKLDCLVLGGVSSESVMEEIRGVEGMESEVISHVTHMVSENMVAVNLLGWPYRRVK